MKLTTVLLITAILQVSASSYAQKINLSEKKVPIQKVFDKISTQTGYDFLFSDDILKDAKQISIEVKNAELKSVLNQIFEGQPLEYSIEDKSIVVSKKAASIIDKIKSALAIPIMVTGRVTDTAGTPLPSATIKIKGQNAITTDKDGNFSFSAENGTDVTVSFIGFKPYSFKVVDNLPFQNITLHAFAGKLDEVVIVNTGYQMLSKRNATGSFDLIDRKTLDKRFTTNILDQLEGNASGVLYNPASGNSGISAVTIRGASTIFANKQPLVVVDNFPYDGDFNNINPNDVESITILKDAAASSIWGVRSGNGVIVITTKKGAYNSKPKIGLTSNISFSGKPDLFYAPSLTPAQVVDIQKFLYENGAYDGAIQSGYQAYPTVAQILEDVKAGKLTSKQAESQLMELGTHDARNDQLKYFYQNQVNQQYALNINGGGVNQKYYVSGGFDKNIGSQVGSSLQRITLNANNTYSLLNNKFELKTGVNFVSNTTLANLDTYTPYSLYDRIIDENGNPLPVYNTYSKSYTESAANSQLLDWHYYPLNNGNSGRTSSTTDYKINTEMSYKILPALKASLNYQYQKGILNTDDNFDEKSFKIRDQVNMFTDLSSGSIVRNFPYGNIFTRQADNYSSHWGRFQLDYNATFNENSLFNATGGIEVNSFNSFETSNTVYGYDPKTASGQTVIYNTEFNNYVTGGTSNISDPTSLLGATDHSRSYWLNSSYSYKQRYTLSGSARKDESNLFGVKANQKGVPLWSIGGAWEISKEPFYKVDWLTYLRIRITDGYNGNLDKTTSAYITANYVGPNYISRLPFTEIVNPPNPSLRWEKINFVNLGLDFGGSNNVLTGSIEIYKKRGLDLIGYGILAPQTGLTQFRGNVNNLETKGLDLKLDYAPFTGTFKWNVSYLLSYSKDIVTKNLNIQNSGFGYVSNNLGSPRENYPIGALFSYKWAGLDNQGNPQGYLDGAISKDYSKIINSNDFSNLVYSGQNNPLYFGSLRNELNYNGFDLSINIVYRLGYYFRRTSLDNSSLYSDDSQIADYQLRWQKPGDEKITDVPSMLYPPDFSRDAFYRSSSVLIEKADNVRLQSIYLGYTLNERWLKSLGLSSMRVYINANNLGMLWKANKKEIDPDFGTFGVPTPKIYVAGLNINF